MLHSSLFLTVSVYTYNSTDMTHLHRGWGGTTRELPIQTLDRSAEELDTC